ncbi:MAG: type II pantothenate kinase [Clostridia bacterium]|nr:type II pantothenate kinase [Clostridia bacterium]
MGIIIGIDVGGSTTKIVGLKEREMISPLMVKANDPKASIYGAFGKFLDDNRLRLTDIDEIMVTGVGSCALEDDIYGIRATKIDEFRAIGRGGLYLSGLDKAIIVSMGTGTAIIAANGADARHICGTGVGGGTLLGLSKKMLNIRDFDSIVQTARGGNLANVDLFVNDLTTAEIPTLPAGTTASNFGRADDLASKSDIAMGIVNMVFETIGVISVLSARMEKTSNIVLAGTLTDMPYTKEVFGKIEPLYNVKFILPAQAEFTTSVGAALCAC